MLKTPKFPKTCLDIVSGRMKSAQPLKIQSKWPSTVIVLYTFASRVQQNSMKNVTKFSFMVKNVHLITLFKRELEGMAVFMGKKKQSLNFLIKCQFMRY